MIIVTGNKGFIGSELWERIPGDKIGVEINNAFYFLNMFTDWDKVDAVYHLGAISDTTETDINKIHRFNVEFTVALFEKCIKYQIPIKYASSASVYGNHPHDEINPLNYYALSKVTIDYFVAENMSKFKHIQGFRFFNVYGKNEAHKKNQASPVYKFTQQAKDTGRILIFENSDHYYRDFVCVEDVCKILLSNEKVSGIYDLGTSKPISFLRVAEIVADRYDATIGTIPFPDHLKGRYQYSTIANREWNDYYFKTVEEWVGRA